MGRGTDSIFESSNLIRPYCLFISELGKNLLEKSVWYPN